MDKVTIAFLVVLVNSLSTIRCVELPSCDQTGNSTHTELPDWCLSPPGDDCLWYSQCLETRHPCTGDPDSYAIDYATVFCNLYTTNYHIFSPAGQAWIDSARKCLIVHLVPALNQCLSCTEIKDLALESHTPCYLKPSSTDPSICDLGPLDWARVFWTIKGAFINEGASTLDGILKVGLGCGRHIFNNVILGR